MASITSTNAVFTLNIAGVVGAAQIQGFSADDMSDNDPVEIVETSMGLDGTLSGGVKPVPFLQKFTLQANSPSIALFDQWFTSMKAAGDVYTANGTVILLSINKKYNLTNGYLKSYKPMPDAKKTLQPQQFSIEWQSVTQAPA